MSSSSTVVSSPQVESAPATEGGAPQRDALTLGVVFHLSAWTLLGLVAFGYASDSWFPELPWLRWGVMGVGVALVLLPWWRATRGAWLVAVHSLSLAALIVVLLEMGMGRVQPRQHEPSRYPFPYRMHGFAPNQHAADNVHNASTNDVGLREPQAIPVSKPAGTLRIMVLGGSAVFGIGAPDGGTAPAHLERMLSGAKLPLPPGYERVEVINAGQGWYNSTQELVFFVTDLWRYEPDIVFVVDGYNDVHHSVVWRIPPPLNQVSFDATNLMRGLPGFGDEPAWQHAFYLGAHASALRRLLGIPPEQVFRPARSSGGAVERRLSDPRAAEPALFETLLANWLAFDALADRLGFRVHFALQPVIYNKQPLLPEEARFFEQVEYAEAVGAVWARLETAAGERAQRHGLDLFQSDTYLRRSDKPLFLDYCHLVSDGYALMARSMADVVVEDLRHWQRETAASELPGSDPLL